MSTPEIPEPTAEVQRQLEMANSQLAMYARDLKRIVDAERQRARELAATHQQLQAYANDLKTLFDAERLKAQELAEANGRLQILDRLKTDFLTFISHELRTPLSSIYVANIFDPGDPKERAEMISLIQKGYQRLEGLIEKGLEYFTWLAKQADTSGTTDLAVVVRHVADGIPGLAEPGVDFQISSPGVPCLVRGEENYLAEVVQILLNNALKFSQKEKFIRVDLRATAQKVTLRIADHGRGFAPELAQEIFRPFTIGDVMHHSQGTGLNLAFAGAIVEAYGGQIRTESEGVGKGAMFTVEFPAFAERKNGE